MKVRFFSLSMLGMAAHLLPETMLKLSNALELSQMNQAAFDMFMNDLGLV